MMDQNSVQDRAPGHLPVHLLRPAAQKLIPLQQPTRLEQEWLFAILGTSARSPTRNFFSAISNTIFSSSVASTSANTIRHNSTCTSKLGKICISCRVIRVANLSHHTHKNGLAEQSWVCLTMSVTNLLQPSCPYTRDPYTHLH